MARQISSQEREASSLTNLICNGEEIINRSHQNQQKLHSHKSSFQAWKTVSFACSLVAMFLIFIKWHEVSNDLKMLAGIESLLLGASPNQVHPSNGTGSSIASLTEALQFLNDDNNENATSMGHSEREPAQPATGQPDSATLARSTTVHLNAQNAPDHNHNHDHNQSLAINQILLLHPLESLIGGFREQMHLLLSQELSSLQLLRVEIELFSAEFKSSKSTLLLSLILVSFYIISWILMTLAIKDTRISNDISLRNILLLSVFGAIDIAASLAFVMVRLIMFSVKNNPFASDLLQAIGLRDSSIRMSANQASCFAALRLVAMRSSAANVDLFVGGLVALVTLLRLYAVTRALTYYRRLRRQDGANSAGLDRRPRRHAPSPLNLHLPVATFHSTTNNGGPHSYQGHAPYSDSKGLWSPHMRAASFSYPTHGPPTASFVNPHPNLVSGGSSVRGHHPSHQVNSNGQSSQQQAQLPPSRYEQATKFLMGSLMAAKSAADFHSHQPAAETAMIHSARVDMEQQQEQLKQQTNQFYTSSRSFSLNNNNRDYVIATVDASARNQNHAHLPPRRRHGSVDAIRAPLDLGTELVLVSSSKLDGAARVGRLARAASSPRPVAPVCQQVNQQQQAGLIMKKNSITKAYECDSEPVSPRRASRIDLGLGGRRVVAVGEPQMAPLELLEPAQLEPQLHQTPNRYQHPKMQTHRRSSLQDLVLEAEAGGQAELVSSPVQVSGFSTLRVKDLATPTLYKLFRPQQSKQSGKNNPRSGTEVNNATGLNRHQRQQATKYKLVARYRQLSSLDSSNRTTTGADNSSFSDNSNSSSSCPDSDASGNDLRAPPPAPGMMTMKQSEEYVTINSNRNNNPTPTGHYVDSRQQKERHLIDSARHHVASATSGSKQQLDDAFRLAQAENHVSGGKYYYYA